MKMSDEATNLQQSSRYPRYIVDRALWYLHSFPRQDGNTIRLHDFVQLGNTGSSHLRKFGPQNVRPCNDLQLAANH